MITLVWVLASTMFASSVGIIALTIFDLLKARKQSAYEWSDCKTAYRRLAENSVGLGDTFREEPPLSRERFGIDKTKLNV